MFDRLTERLGDVFDRLKRRGALSEADVDAALREVRVALLEADVALEVVKDFVVQVRLRAIGQEVVRNINPGQMVIKIVHDHLVEMLGATSAETLLVADAMTGQDAVNLAKSFHEKIGISGIVLTRVDGDARGGAALSMRSVTGQPIKLIGLGEKLDALDVFYPDRIAGRILG